MTSVRNRSTGRPTLDQVASLAGVGRGTVSRVVNGSEQVSVRARQAVEQAIAELGYVPNRAARALVTQRTDSIALVVPEPGERFFTEPFFGRIVQAISAALAGSELQMLLMIAQSPDERRRLDGYLSRQHVDGALLLSLHGSDDALPERLEERGVAAVRVGRPAHPGPACYVDADNRGGAQKAASYLVEQGRKRIATITGPLDMAVGLDRLGGYRDVVKSGPVAVADFSEESGAAAMRWLLEHYPDVDAVFAASDPMAAGALRVIKESGRRVPHDVAVVGFDDSFIARHTDPHLTTVYQPVEAMGKELVRLLLAKLAGESPDRQQVVLDTHLVVRDSA
ncbi:LacI family transcriptional regulator [Planosporangium flavigriseum]|uniref:LacI family transcriptional regulator n=1 Tax=Planosporangium flavigriseum TaxID=373681 RepID=A0A8J3LPQ0_9ACTN|nr:LacI family DNA-binding transcriptional regulator [Planosporangium flavigriseum]NJC65951.1 LacI family transcriptional regulator [Planosporangium flavigriseum]GIG74585.1 LacI family transcriptional regulator [Planosporangium flavigriseum]